MKLNLIKQTLIITILFISFHACKQKIEQDFPLQISTTNSNEHKRIEGTKVFAKIPRDYKPIKELARFQKNENLYFQVIETNQQSFSVVKDKILKQKNTSKNAVIDYFKEIKLNEFDCIYLEGPSKTPEETKLALTFGNDDFLVMVAGVCKQSDIKGKKELQKIFKSIFYEKSFDLNPMELADFEFDKSITGFEYVMTASNMFTYSDSQKFDIDNPTSNIISIGIMPKLSNEFAYQYLINLISRYEQNGIQFENKNITELTINTHKAFVLESNVQYQNKSGIIYQVIMLDNDKSLVFTGNAYSNLENLKKQFKETVKTIQIK